MTNPEPGASRSSAVLRGRRDALTSALPLSLGTPFSKREFMDCLLQIGGWSFYKGSHYSGSIFTWDVHFRGLPRECGLKIQRLKAIGFRVWLFLEVIVGFLCRIKADLGLWGGGSAAKGANDWCKLQAPICTQGTAAMAEAEAKCLVALLQQHVDALPEAIRNALPETTASDPVRFKQFQT